MCNKSRLVAGRKVANWVVSEFATKSTLLYTCARIYNIYIIKLLYIINNIYTLTPDMGK